MKNFVRDYFETLKRLFDQTTATDTYGQTYPLDEAIDMAVLMITEQATTGGKLLFIGNGASASIASHMAADFLKNVSIQALAFNDGALLTCISNDYGYRHVFEKPIQAFTEPSDILVAISSSGQSENILLGVSAAKQKGARVITLSGFAPNNPLRKCGDINFYVPSSQYGYVESLHHAICHCLVDTIISSKSELAANVLVHT
jgi:D-sedoheptulose 7-phosphate isomerase